MVLPTSSDKWMVTSHHLLVCQMALFCMRVPVRSHVASSFTASQVIYQCLKELHDKWLGTWLVCAESLVDTWLPSIAEVAMVAPHERQKAGAESHLDGDAKAPHTAYLIMLLSGPMPSSLRKL